jgi:Zn-dependent protease
MIRDFTILNVGGVKIVLNRFSIIASLMLTAFFALFGIPFYFRGCNANTYWLISLLVLCCVVLISIVQEISRIICMHLMSCSVRKSTIFLLGSIEDLSEVSKKGYTAECISAAVGIFYSLMVVAIFHQILLIGKNNRWPIEISACCTGIYLTNVIAALCNIFPASPFDGGKLLKSFLFLLTRSNSISLRCSKEIGAVLGLLIVTAGILMAVEGMIIGCVCFIIAGICIYSAACQQDQKINLKKEMDVEKIATVMHSIHFDVRHNTTLSTFIQEFLLKYPKEYFPVFDQNQRFLNVITARQVIDVEIDNRGCMPIIELAAQSPMIPVMAEHTEIIDAFSFMIEEQCIRFIVAESDSIRDVVGVVTVDDLEISIIGQLVLSLENR